jgi:glycosyltransferase involved in cell wall biosynthesis
MSQPKISVLIAAFNAEAYVADSVESVLRQNGPPTELIVVDDGSCDGTKAVLDRFSHDICLLEQENRGATAARNRAWRASCGEYIVILDADDRLTAESIRVRSDYLDKHPNVDVVYGETDRIDISGAPIGRVPLRRKLREDDIPYEAFAEANVFPVHAGMTRRRVFEELTDLHDEQLDLVGDWDLWARVAENHRFAYVPDVVAQYRIHDGMSLRNLTRDRGLWQTMNTLKRIASRRAFRDLDNITRLRSLARYAICCGRLRCWREVWNVLRLTVAN